MIYLLKFFSCCYFFGLSFAAVKSMENDVERPFLMFYKWIFYRFFFLFFFFCWNVVGMAFFHALDVDLRYLNCFIKINVIIEYSLDFINIAMHVEESEWGEIVIESNSAECYAILWSIRIECGSKCAVARCLILFILSDAWLIGMPT